MQREFDNWQDAVVALQKQINDLTLRLSAEQCYNAAVIALVTAKLDISQEQVHEAVIVGLRQLHRINPRGEAVIEIIKERLPPELFDPDGFP